MKGSIWRKWDLHLHTPKTKLSDNFKIEGKDDIEIWNKFCQTIEESDVSVFGITDYFCCENYFKFLEIFKNQYPDSKKVFFPNIEFRLPIAVNKKGEEVNIHLIFDNKLDKSKIDEFLISVKTHFSDGSEVYLNCKSLKPEHFASTTVALDEIKRKLKEVFGTSKPYLIVAAANNAGLRPTNSPRKLSITDEIDKDCDAFFGGAQNIEYYLKTDRYEEAKFISKQKPVLSGCDAHSFEDLDTKLGKKLVDSADESIIICNNTWIKADCTFEGLKQVIYEPKFRILIQEGEPRSSNRKIDYIKLNFPNNIKIARIGSSSSQEFCLKNLSNKIYFSDYFTCIVGGRGTGKSTIINLIGEKQNENTDFFKNNQLQLDNKIYNIVKDESNFVEISGTNDIEFVSQGKIENLAEANKLTSLIFDERIRNLDSKFDELDNEISNIIKHIDSNIKTVEDLYTNRKLKETKTSEKETNQKIIDSVNDKEYKAITDAIGEIKNETNALMSSKSQYSELLKDLRVIINKYKISDQKDDYANRYNELLSLVSNITEIQLVEGDITIVENNYQSYNDRISKLNEAFASENLKLKDFFTKKGTSEDVVKDSQNANEKNARLIQEIHDLEAKSKLYIDTFKLNDTVIQTYESKADTYEKLINHNLEVINNRLDVENENLLKISFDSYFDNSKFKENVFDEFHNYFNKYHIPGTSKKDIKKALFDIDPSDVLSLDYRKFTEEFETKISLNSNRNTNYIRILENVFKENANFIIYKLIVKKHRFNIPAYIKFKGYYGDNDLMSCSFGQRCTAVVVTLLMTGIKPLIIDEPEAHLDNKLIAEYLVELIKTKKPDRQIIFASHNSNFVINGDSELIHILDIPHTDIFTSITSTTIENTSYRDRLLRLEGGREAFKTRENKYAI